LKYKKVLTKNNQKLWYRDRCSYCVSIWKVWCIPADY